MSGPLRDDRPTSSRGVPISTEPRINDRIRVPEVRLVGPNGETVGIVPTDQALKLAQEADLVCRYQGGPNAGHTIAVGDETYKIRQIPSGIVGGVASAAGSFPFGSVSPRAQRAIMLGYVGVKFLDQELSAVVRGAARPVRVAKLPFVPKRYKK